MSKKSENTCRANLAQKALAAAYDQDEPLATSWTLSPTCCTLPIVVRLAQQHFEEER